MSWNETCLSLHSLWGEDKHSTTDVWQDNKCSHVSVRNWKADRKVQQWQTSDLSCRRRQSADPFKAEQLGWPVITMRTMNKASFCTGCEEAKAGPEPYWSEPSQAEGGQQRPAGGKVSGAAVRRLRLHYIDGLQLLNLSWPSAGSNVGHRGGPGWKSVGEGWATKIYPT